MWNHFADLNAIPRPSKKEEEVIQFYDGLGNKLGFKTFNDEVGNVFILKPGSKGFEDRPRLFSKDISIWFIKRMLM